MPKDVFVNPIFTGREVTRQVLLPESKEYEMNIINFGKGVRNKFHTHDYEQILTSWDDKCRFATVSLGLWAVPPKDGTSGRILKPGISEKVYEIEDFQDQFSKGTDIAGKKALKIGR